MEKHKKPKIARWVVIKMESWGVIRDSKNTHNLRLIPIFQKRRIEEDQSKGKRFEALRRCQKQKRKDSKKNRMNNLIRYNNDVYVCLFAILLFQFECRTILFKLLQLNPSIKLQKTKKKVDFHHQILQNNKMTQNKQLESYHIKRGDHEESSLLSSGNNQHFIDKNKQPQRQSIRDEDPSVCTWALWMGMLFCFFFGVVVYRYANSQYAYGNDLSVDSANIVENVKHLDGGVSLESKDSKMKTGKKQTQDTQNIVKDQVVSLQPTDTLINGTQSSETSQKAQQRQQHKFPIPYTIWLFPTPKTVDHKHNIQHYSTAKRSTVQRVTMENYNKLIKSKTVLSALDLLEFVQLRQQKLQMFAQQLVMFTLLEENGGVIIGGDLILTEGLDERRLMKRVQDEGKGFGMFVYGGGANPQKESKVIEIDFENYFVAAAKHFWLLEELIPEMASALQQEIESTFPSHKNLLKRYKTSLNQIISRKYLEYTQLQQSTQDTNAFLQHFKIFLFGSKEQLEIASPYLLNLSLPAHFQFLSTYSEDAFQELFGPLNPLVHLPLQLYSQFINQLKTSPNDPILTDSFIYSHMLSFSSTYSTIKPLSPQTNPQKYSLWKLPKILWTFINKLNEKSPLHDHFIANLIARAKESQFELIVLTQETIQALLDGNQLHEIFSNFENDQTEYHHTQNQQVLSSLVKWYILKNYGGIFVDFGHFLLQNLNWVTRIKSNQHVFNNFDKDPEVLIFYNHSDVEEWSVNINYGIKIAHNLTYLTKGFVATVKNSSFIANEIDKILYMLKNPNNLEISNIRKHQQKGSKKFLKIWSISSLLGGDKMDLPKGRKQQCFVFKDSLSHFRQKYGSLGYVSELITDVSAQQLNENLFSLDDGSIFRPFFVTKIIDKKEIEKVKSLKEVSLNAQKIKK